MVSALYVITDESFDKAGHGRGGNVMEYRGLELEK